MRGKIVSTIAIVGTVAALAIFNMNYDPTGMNFLTVESEVEVAFNNYLTKYKKSVGSKSEYQQRLAVFTENYHKIMTHNMLNSQKEGYTMAVNPFADMTPAEYKKMLGYKPQMKKESNPRYVHVHGDVPTSVDWRQKNAVTPIKNQGSCGSCWSFSATGAIEGAYAIKSGNLISLSEQQLVDCSTKQGNEGCNGGLMDFAFQYAEEAALETEADYPYQGSDEKCAFDASKGQVKITNFVDVPANSTAQLEVAVAQGPVSVAIEADSLVFQFYFWGVIKSSWCGTNLDHGVLVVGYGSDSGTDYWILKNSWGSWWGEKGYFRIKRGGDGPGICGLQLQASYPTI